jgi:adenine-specific DNA-methyltransferase
MLPTYSVLIARCRELRQNATDAEQLLWKVLRNRQVCNAKFRRQYLFRTYILDFYCPEIKLAIELDGGQHLEQEGYDRRRTEELNSYGIRMVRFWNHEVLQHLEDVVKEIWKAVEDESKDPEPSPPPSPSKA